MPSHTFYTRLRRLTARFLRGSIPKLHAFVRKSDSPLRALCLEYGDQVEFNLRVQSLDQWKKRESGKNYWIGEGWDSKQVTRDQLRRLVRRGGLSRNDACCITGHTFAIRRIVPEAFGLSARPARVLPHEYFVGNFDSVGAVPNSLFPMLSDYWSEYEERYEDDKELDGRLVGRGESRSFIRRHRDAAFVRAVRGGMRDASRGVLNVQHTDDFIAFLALVESEFEPSSVVFGNKKQLKTN